MNTVCMEPEKLPATAEISQVITTEYAVKNLLDEVQTLLQAKSGIDEHKAKVLRKSWDELRGQSDPESVDLSTLEQRFEKLRVRIHDQVALRNKQYAEIEEQIEQLKAELKTGDLKKSQQLEQSIINGLNKIRGLSSQRRQKVIQEIEVLQPKIKKLSSWRHWGTLQAREKIIEEIEGLHETEKNLEKVATRIKQARDEWKEWDNSGEGGDKKLYLKFDAACTKAYLPCKAMFDTQRKQRKDASRNRSAICELLESQYEKIDWREPDWREIQQLIREQQTMWRKAGGAEFKDRKPLQKRFDLAMEKFDGPLSRERKRNFQLRKDLVDQINALLAVEDTRKAISTLQGLKKGWQVTVSATRGQERSIWKQFTKACDGIYDKSRRVKKEFDQQLNSQLDAKKSLCDEIESGLKVGSADSAALASQISKWKTAWADSGNVPKVKAHQIDKRFRDAMGMADKALARLQQEDQSQTDQKLFASAAICEQLEQLVFTGADLETAEPEQSLVNLEELDDKVQIAMQNRISLIKSAAGNQAKVGQIQQSFEKRFDQVNGYLLQLEINSGVDSPAEYAKQKMALQIGRLSAAMGKSAEQELLDSKELIVRIHTIAGIDPAKRNEINQRFNKCYQAL